MNSDSSDSNAPQTLTFLNPELRSEAGEHGDFGKYKILSKIAEHGQGIVLLGFDSNLSRQVVIKIGRSQLAAEAQSTIAEEAKALARLDHPNLARIYELAFDAQAHPYIVMEHIDGRNLADLLRDRKLSPTESSALIKQLANAIDHAHQAGVVHCDLKPSNVVIRKDGVPKIIDFGLSRINKVFELDDNSGSSGGTIPYMAPEQANALLADIDGRIATDIVDELSDVFSLGAMLYEMLTGQRLYHSYNSVTEGLQQAASGSFDNASLVQSKIPSVLRSACSKALEKDRLNRFQSARAFIEALPVPRQGSIRRYMISVAALIMVSTGIWLAVTNNGVVPKSTSDSSDASAESTSADPSPYVEVKRFEIKGVREQGDKELIDSIENLAPLRPSDRVRFSIELAEPAFVKLFWLDSTGQADEIYPKDPDGRNSGDSRVRIIESPVKVDHGWPLEPHGALELAVLIVSRDKISRSSIKGIEWDKNLTAEVGYYPLPPEAGTKTRYGNFEPRGLAGKSKQIDSPILRLKESLRRTDGAAVHVAQIPFAYRMESN